MRLPLRGALSRSFQRKLLLFVLSAVVITTVLQFLYLIYNFRAVTDFALQQNTTGMRTTVEEFLSNYAQEKATSTGLQLRAAQDNLGVLGRSAQQLVDSYDSVRANPAVLNMALFQTNTEQKRGALTGGPGERFEIFVPPALASDPHAKEIVQASAILNMTIEGVYAGNPNNNFVYFVGDEAAPITRGYPRINLVDQVPDEQLNLDFWKDYFPGAVASWSRWYNDPELQKTNPSPITIVGPYADAAGQGLVVTMFYPLWDKQAGRFAGAVGADIKLDTIIQNILTFKVARTGFAFLMNGKGEVVAMPETGFKLFGIDLKEVKQGSLVYYRGALASSSRTDVQQLASSIQSADRGLLKIDLARDGGPPATELISFASLPALADGSYARDQWKIVIAVPEAEVLEVLTKTDAAVNAERTRMSTLSLVIVILSLAVVALISRSFARVVTRDLRTLAHAAEGVSAKRYDVEVALRSSDEIGQLGQAFQTMAREIRDYTVNLEGKVAERTADLQRANDEISRLNEQLRGENLRLGAELDVARRLQMMVLPPEAETRAVRELDIGCFMRPADEVGGDYYDVLQSDDSVYIGIGDVTGHGLPAGIIMLMAQTAFLTLSQSGERDMQRVVSMLNRVLYRNIERIQEDKNMTLAVLEYRHGEVSIVGQHESVVICRAGGGVEVIDTADLGLPMGLEEDIAQFVSMRQLRLEAGDVMVLYTDGVTEAENSGRQQYGLQSLVRALPAYRELPAVEIVQRVITDVFAFIGETRIYDDISLLVVKQR